MSRELFCMECATEEMVAPACATPGCDNAAIWCHPDDADTPPTMAQPNPASPPPATEGTEDGDTPTGEAERARCADSLEKAVNGFLAYSTTHAGIGTGLILAARNAVRALRREPLGWQPIETAPRDGTPVLVTDGEVVLMREWLDGGTPDLIGWHGEDGFMVDSDDPPTHWMPLPAPPLGAVTHGEGEGE